MRLFALTFCWLLSAGVHGEDRPNIVLIVADDIGFSDFGAFGGEIATPHIDALAESGVRFSNFHAASSCAPTRAMLLTGVDNHLAGIGSMRELMPLSHRGKPGYDGVLSESVRTVAALLQRSGYRTSVAGKWHLGVEERNLPPARGFDYSFIQADSGSDNFSMRPYLPMTPEARWFENGRRLESLPEDFYSSRYFVDATIEFLQSNAAGRQPFFAYIAFQANHTPLQAPAAFLQAYRGSYLEGWAATRAAREQRLLALGIIDEGATLAQGPPAAQWDALDTGQQRFEARRMQAYAAMATAMDHETGRLVSYLKSTGQYANTVFIVLSDNGATATEPYENAFGRRWLQRHYHRDVETLGGPGSWVAAGRHWGSVSNTPFSGTKFTASEGGLRVPLIISGMRGTQAGHIERAFTHVTDIAPTLLAVADIAPAQSAAETLLMQGRSLTALIRAETATHRDANHVTGYEFSGNAAVFRGDYKLLRNLPPAGDGRWRLFNLRLDPGETNDLSAANPQLREELLAAWDIYAERVGVLPMPENYELSRQVAVNMLINIYLPRYAPWFAAVAAGLLLIVMLVRHRARGNHR